ncbi:hypothetical protein [Rhizohabitans arisaemae]|uniref:hypothetical protein n=1 Tax=Rhizohabitans arisaemae TaxID=2720610 RepID=UPI0024B06F28|nr:hypothetical protein [Rhizohabitans arisaemae]
MLAGLLVGGGALLVALVIVVVFAVSRQSVPEPVAGVSAPPSSASPESRTKGPVPDLFVTTDAKDSYAKLADRADDPDPVTENEAFADDARTPSYKGFDLKLEDSRIDSDCAAGVWGDRLEALLVSGGCTQLLRGYFYNRNREYVAQIALFNMANETSARAVAVGLDPDPNPGQDGALGFMFPMADSILQGPSKAYAEARGHYLIVSWVARADNSAYGDGDDLIALSVTAEDFKDFITRRLNRR